MHITKDILNNKLALFTFAGYPAESGWDTAIPQSVFDTLLSFGVENPGGYFVFDCKSKPWALHHTGEAVFDILVARSKANEEFCYQLMGPRTDDDQDQLFWKWLIHSHPVMEEANAGFANLSMMNAAWNNGYHEGRKSLVNETK